MTGLQTEFDFTLPKGYVDSTGTLHRVGTMRLATARDEIEPLRDPRVSGPDDPFLTVIVLSRVVTRLGTLSQVTPREIENLFAACGWKIDETRFVDDTEIIWALSRPGEKKRRRWFDLSRLGFQSQA